MGNRTKILIFILIPFFVWIVGFGYQIYKASQFEGIGSDVNASEVTFIINAKVVEELSDEEIILYDKMKHLVFIYDYEGTLINKFKLYHVGSVEVIDYKNEELLVFYRRSNSYYLVNEQGIIADVYEGNLPEDVPVTSRCINNDTEVCVKNYFFYSTLSIDGETTFMSYSFLPFIVLILSSLFLGFRLNKKYQLEEAE